MKAAPISLAGVVIEPLAARHRKGLDEFVAAIAVRDRSFADRTLISQVAVASWTQAVPERRLVAVEDNGSIAGVATLVPGVGWSTHVAEIRVVVRGDRRGAGVGRALAVATIDMASTMGLRKLTVETIAANAGGQAIFQALGFAEEARLPGQVCDDAGSLQDVVVLSRWLDTPAG